MDYELLVADFAERTSSNLAAIRRMRANGDAQVFEVTALINSMLGLLVLPHESYVRSIPAIPLHDLRSQGWPVPRVIEPFPNVADLRTLIRYLRNAVAHFNIEFLVDAHLEIVGLRVWNERWDAIRKAKNKTWEAELSLVDLEAITQRFIELLREQRVLPRRGRGA